MSLKQGIERWPDDYATTVRRLNARWNLGLPESLSCDKAFERRINLDDELGFLQRSCVRNIEYLSSNSDFSLRRLLEDFDEAANAMPSMWISKPSQERGTLLNMPLSKSFVHRDVVGKVCSQQDSAVGTPSKHRQELLILLERLLVEERNLAQESDAYSRSCGPSLHKHAQRLTFQRHAENPEQQTRLSTMPPKRPSQKRKVDKESSLSKEANKKKVKNESLSVQRNLRLFFHPSNSTSNTVLPTVSSNFTSFESISPTEHVFDTQCNNAQTSSNDTSLVKDDEILQPTQYSRTQEFHEYYQDPSFTQSLKAAEDVAIDESKAIVHQLVTSGPFRKPAAIDNLSPHVPFRYHYECDRLSKKAAMSSHNFFKEIIKQCKSDKPSFSSFRDATRTIYSQATSPTKLLHSEISSAAAWDSACENFTTATGDRSVMLSGTLEWAEKEEQGLFTLKMSPLRLEKSCRFDRRFGGDRLLFVTLPCFQPRHMPRNLSSKADIICTAVSQWLGRETHFIAGRYWRAFYVEATESKRKSTKVPSFKVCMFAIDGVDFQRSDLGDDCLGGRASANRTRVSINEFLEWYMPIMPNIGSFDKKFFQRLKLGLSRTTPTIVLEQQEFIILEDDPSWPMTMNDGCARISRKLANKIAQQLGLGHTPSAFQARISGAKGLWIVENNTTLYPEAGSARGFWIEVSGSQLKVEPHPRQRTGTDPHHRTFEVVTWTNSPKVGKMSLQLTGILHHGGVSTDCLEQRLRENTRGYYNELVAAMRDPRHLRLWARQHEKVSRDKEIAMLGAFPRDRPEQINFLLESGFSPVDNGEIISRLQRNLKGYLEDYADRLPIEIAMSTKVWCVPDPYGVLEPGEIHLSFSKPCTGSEGEDIMSIDGLDCIVFRSPGYLPSDAQKVRGVFRSELQHLPNLVVMSTKGDIPLASLLSGGDYDGDTCTVIFDQDIVQQFENTDPPGPLSAADCNLLNRSRRLDDIFFSSTTTNSEVGTFLTGCFSFNLSPSFLGLCSAEHEKVAYHRGYDDPAAIKLAIMAGYLVDADKQGYFLSHNAWNSLVREINQPDRLTEPAFKSKTGEVKVKATSIIDHLKLGIAKTEQDDILANFSKTWPEGFIYDQTLTLPFKDARKKYTQASVAEQDTLAENIKAKERYAQNQIGQDILLNLTADVEAFRDHWKPRFRSDKDDEEGFSNIIHRMHEAFQKITPRSEKDHDICRRFEDEHGREFSEWSRLRASCLYVCWYRGVAIWYAAGNDLARIKAESKGTTRVMTSAIHHIMKPDSKLVLRMQLDEEEDGIQDTDEDLLLND